MHQIGLKDWKLVVKIEGKKELMQFFRFKSYGELSKCVRKIDGDEKKEKKGSICKERFLYWCAAYFGEILAQ